MTYPIIGFAGMTHLGLNSAAAAAAHGFKVVAFDIDPHKIERLKLGIVDINEPDLSATLDQFKNVIEYTSNKDELNKCDVVYISTDVPTNEQGTSNLNPIHLIVETVIPCLNSEAVLVVLCQVPPGFTESINFPAFRLFYQVETLIFGRAIERALSPERFIIGCDNPKLGLPRKFDILLKQYGCPVLRMSYKSAELCKISINMFLVASVTSANTLAELCESIGANWSEITPALKLDRRIGAYAYLEPGLGLAGGNLERDLQSVLDLSGRVGSDSSIVRAMIRNSAIRRDWPWQQLLKFLGNELLSSKIGILGLAYKENTHSTKNSPALQLLSKLTNKALMVKVHDPVVQLSSDFEGVEVCSAVEHCFEDTDAVVIATPWPQYKKIDPLELKTRMKGKLVLDPYKVLALEACSDVGLKVIRLGHGYKSY